MQYLIHLLEAISLLILQLQDCSLYLSYQLVHFVHYVVLFFIGSHFSLVLTFLYALYSISLHYSLAAVMCTFPHCGINKGISYLILTVSPFLSLRCLQEVWMEVALWEAKTRPLARIHPSQPAHWIQAHLYLPHTATWIIAITLRYNIITATSFVNQT